MEQVTNIEQLKAVINRDGEIVISKENNNMVIMNMKEYEEKKIEKDIEKHLLKAEDDIEKGRVHDARKVFEEWRVKYNLQDKTIRGIYRRD